MDVGDARARLTSGEAMGPILGATQEVVMVFLGVWALGLIAAAIHVALGRARFSRRQVIEVFLLYQIVLGFGLAGVVGFMGHALNPVQTAHGIGWPPAPQF